MYWQATRAIDEREKSTDEEEEGALKRVKRLGFPLSTPTLTSTSRFLPDTYYMYKPQNSNKKDTQFTHTKGGGQVADIDNENTGLTNDDGKQTLFHQQEGISDPRLKLYSNKTLLVLILVHSGADQKIRRDAIRNTWLSSAMVGNVSLTYWFIIGGKLANNKVRTSLLEEQKQYNDLMLLWNVRNNYSDLSMRSLQSMVHISMHYRYKFMLKTDDDVFLNTPIILSELESMYPLERLYWGHFSCHNPPMEDGRWKEKSWHWCDVYYPYAYGGMYVLSQDVVQLIADNANSLQYYSCEDVSLGAWLAPYNLHRLNDARIFVQHGTKCSRGYIAIHIQHHLCHKVMKKYFDNLKRNGVMCTTLAKEDILVWEGLPHMCLNNTKVII